MDLEESCNQDRILVYPDFDVNSTSNEEAISFCGFNKVTAHTDVALNLILVFQSDDIVQGRGFLANLSVLSVL